MRTYADQIMLKVMPAAMTEYIRVPGLRLRFSHRPKIQVQLENPDVLLNIRLASPGSLEEWAREEEESSRRDWFDVSTRPAEVGGQPAVRFECRGERPNSPVAITRKLLAPTSAPFDGTHHQFLSLSPTEDPVCIRSWDESPLELLKAANWSDKENSLGPVSFGPQVQTLNTLEVGSCSISWFPDGGGRTDAISHLDEVVAQMLKQPVRRERSELSTESVEVWGKDSDNSTYHVAALRLGSRWALAQMFTYASTPTQDIELWESLMTMELKSI